ncbi:MAG: hypothetical protein COB25_000220 [Oceanospirillales bacterium]|nr:hypothetical protein [Oceanospirillales bacterium]
MTAAALGIALDIKPFIFVFAIIEILSRYRLNWSVVVLSIAKCFVILALANSIFAIVDILSGDSFGVLGHRLIRGVMGLSAPNGLFTFKFGSATLTMFGCIAAVSLSRETASHKYMILAVYFVILLTLHSAVKEMFGALIAFGLHFIFEMRAANLNTRGANTGKRIVVIFTIAFILVSGTFDIVIQTTKERYQAYIVSDSIRGRLYAVSGELALDNFPFGSGAGTYASKPSRTLYYSNIYHDYGLSRYYGASPTYSSFLMDTWWPKILGEAGVFGLITYALFWVWAWFQLGRYFLQRKSGAALFVFACASATLSSSISAAVFTSHLYLPVIGIVFSGALNPMLLRQK